MDSTKWLGPFLCKPTDKSMGFWISRGPEFEQDLEVEVLIRSLDGQLVQTVQMHQLQTKNTYGVLLGESDGTLKPNEEYLYEIVVAGTKWLPLSLSDNDLRFQTMPDSQNAKDPLDFILMSCHGVEAFENKIGKIGDLAWNMWKRLAIASGEKSDCRLIVLGGDQVYMDDSFGEDLSRFDDNDLTTTKKKIYETYFYYWSHPIYRKVLARLPSILMWDDHDIIDGWGSREEAHRKSLSYKWKTYGSLLNEAFWEMQACRNPGIGALGNKYSFSAKMGRTGFLALDLRSERTFDPKSGMATMTSPEHKRKIEDELKKFANSSVETLYIVSPVTVARMSSSVEKSLGGVANMLWSLAARVSYHNTTARACFWSGIFSVLYCSLYFNTPSAPAFVQSIALVLISTYVILNSNSLQKYLPEFARFLKVTFGVFLSIGILVFGFGFLRASQMGDPSTVLAEGLKHAFESSIGESLAGIAMGVGAILFSRKEKRKFSKGLGALALLALFIFSWWRGLPGWEFSWRTLIALSVFVPLGLITISTFLIGLLEKLGVIDEVSGLDDDLKDAWSSESNAKELLWLGQTIYNFSKTSSAKIVLLCGDIHTGGLSEISFNPPGEQSLRVSQITSSPISYVTMPHMVEKFTSGTGALSIYNKSDFSIIGNNLFYRSERNFALVRDRGSTTAVDFYFEDLDRPICVSYL